MNFTRDEIETLANTQSSKERNRVLNDVAVRQQQAAVMSELVADPRWEQFQRHIEAVKRVHQQKAFALESRLSKTLSLDEPSKHELLLHRAWADAMTFVNQFVFELIEKGQSDGLKDEKGS